MSEIEFTRSQIEQLAGKLEDQLELEPRERELLIAIFSAARDRVVEVTEDDSAAKREARRLRDQLLNAFIPGTSNGFTIAPRVGSTPPNR